MKRIGVLGTFVWDEIWHPALGASQPLCQWGGLTYSLSAFAAACPPGAVIHPLSRVGDDLADSALDFVSSLRCIGSSRGVQIVDEPNNRVELRYHDHAERVEHLTGGVSGWTLDELLPLTWDLDALYLNFLAGNELDLPTAQGLRRSLEIPIYADLHSLFLSPALAGPRRPRRLPDWQEWLACFDAIQLNEVELALLGPEGNAGIEFLPSLLEHGPGTVFVTRGERGAAFAGSGVLTHSGRSSWGAPEGSPHPFEVVEDPPPTGPLTGDPTGCGDVWGSVTFCGLVEGRSVRDAIHRGQLAAGAKIGVTRIEELQDRIAAVLHGVRE